MKETDKIAFMGHWMSGNAEEWYEALAAQLKQQNKEDDWMSFALAIETRFSSQFEQCDALRKIDRIVSMAIWSSISIKWKSRIPEQDSLVLSEGKS